MKRPGTSHGPCRAEWTPEGRLALSPLPPLANRLWRRGWVRPRQGRHAWIRSRQGRIAMQVPCEVPVIYKSDEAEAWQEAMARRIREPGLGPLPASAVRRDFRVAVWLYFPDGRRRDPDAPVKLLLDTLATALRADDRYFLPSIKARTVDRVNPRVEVVIEEASR